MFKLKKIILFALVSCLTQSTYTMQRARGFIQRQRVVAQAMKPFAKETARNLTASYLVTQQIVSTRAEGIVLLDILKMQAQIAATKMKIFLWGKN
ncbi:MAG: hypothetical protein EBU90_05680 [Proteobacteria bacterium]|nr:hypothetical protein [Pseudomonadota bacterium]NBP13946.1 hypothetical protein [bacterium]